MSDPRRESMELLATWRARTRKAQKAYYLSSARLARLHYWTGIPVVIATTVMGSAIFGTLNSQPSAAAQITFGTLSILAAVLAALQTFLRFAERAEQHRIAAATFTTLKNDAEHLSACPPDDDAELRTALDALRARMNEAFQKAPPAIQKAWDEAGE